MPTNVTWSIFMHHPRPLTQDDLNVPGRVIINRKQLALKLPLSSRLILDMEKRGEFPRRFAIGRRAVGWDLGEVDAWIAARQDAATPTLPATAAA